MATEGLTDGHRRVLTEMLGEYRCNDTGSDCLTDRTRFCDYCEYHVLSDLRDYTTGNDMVAVKEALEKSGEWWNFYQFCLYEYIDSGNPNPMFPHNFFAWLLVPERFCWLVAEFVMKKGGESK